MRFYIIFLYFSEIQSLQSFSFISTKFWEVIKKTICSKQTEIIKNSLGKRFSVWLA